MGLEPLVDGPCQHKNPLRNVYRAKNLKAFYAKRLLFMATPRILPPSATKLLYATRMERFLVRHGKRRILQFRIAMMKSLPTRTTMPGKSYTRS